MLTKTHKRIEKLEQEVKKLWEELRILQDRVVDFHVRGLKNK